MTVSKRSAGMTISVRPQYMKDYSNPLLCEYMFAYTVTLENGNAFPVRLLYRHWYIFDSDGSYREVEGEGVVGTMPIISAAEWHEYISGVNLHTELGRMHGSYTMENLITRERFQVEVPAFILTYPPKLN
jgi:ApaG protein